MSKVKNIEFHYNIDKIKCLCSVTVYFEYSVKVVAHFLWNSIVFLNYNLIT